MAYNELFLSEIFKSNLFDLNNVLYKSLITNKYSPLLLGNLFYDHLQPNFHAALPNKILEDKRRRLYDVAQKCTTAFEIGVNGGHSSFLLLESNPRLTLVGMDIAAFYPPEPTCHPEIYVPAALEHLESKYPDRFKKIIGDCLVECPKYCTSNNYEHIDLLHIDGAKSTYERDFYSMLPVLKNGAYIIFDDTQNPYVRNLVDKLKRLNKVVSSEYPPMHNSIVYRHEIVRVNK
jgi:hypothetical protein